MKTIRNILATLILFSLVFSGVAFAGKGSYVPVNTVQGKPGIQALRANVNQWRANKGLSTDVAFKIRRIELSKSGKSAQVLVQNNNGSKNVYALNVRLGNGQVSDQLNLGFFKPATARKVANLFARRDNGTFSGINFVGLNSAGNYVFKEETSRDAVVVNTKTGQARRYNNPSWLTNYTSSVSLQNLVDSKQISQSGFGLVE